MEIRRKQKLGSGLYMQCRFYWNFGNQTEKNWGFLVRSVFLESAPRVTKRKSVLPSAAKANAPASQSSVEYSDSSDEEAYRRQQWGPSVNPAAGCQHAHGASTSSAAPRAGAKLADRLLFTSFHPHPMRTQCRTHCFHPLLLASLCVPPARNPLKLWS